MLSKSLSFIAGMAFAIIVIWVLSSRPNLSLEQMKYQFAGRIASEATRKGLEVVIAPDTCRVSAASPAESLDGIDHIVSCRFLSDHGQLSVTYSVTSRGVVLISEGWEERYDY